MVDNVDLFPKEFTDKLKRDLPEAERNLVLAEKRLMVAKAAGADVKERETNIFKLRQQINKIKIAFRIV